MRRREAKFSLRGTSREPMVSAAAQMGWMTMSPAGLESETKLLLAGKISINFVDFAAFYARSIPSVLFR
jgi:hypothetical protein